MISDAFIAKKQLEYDARGVEKKEVRSYEVSLWTLQDTFITVLKWSDIQQRGRIENPRMTLSTDGTQSFEFSIPMYIRQDGELIENPNWYTMHDGNLLAATRKVKVIFNKGEDDEAVYEFIILDVTETHDNDILTCDVKCEGLAFHELGKVGYNYSLSQDDFILDYKNWAEGNKRDSTPEPIENLDYWCQKINLLPLKDAQVINPRQWYYKVEMGYANTSSASVVYEKPFAASWELDSNSGKLVATSLTESREKARPIEASQSNIYNITQSIAEAFQVFCRYEYGYDANYHIISRTVVFYNSLLMEQDGISSITYPYNSGHITRDKDATNLTTKLYVLNLEDESAFDGYRSIMNVDANKTRENYILNFDYMHEIGNVDDEQYEKISDYEKQWREINLELTRLQGNLAALQTQKPEIEGKLAACKKSIEVGNEQISQNRALEAALVETYGDKTGQYIEIPENNPDTCFAYKQGNKYVVKLNSSNKGIDPKSVRVYLEFDSTASDPKYCLLNKNKFNKHGKIKQIFDDAGNLTSLELKVTDTSSDFTMPSHVYLTYNYNPKLYYDKIIDMWGQRIAIDTRKRDQYEKQLYGAVLNGVNIEEADSQLGVPKLPGLLKKIKNLENEIKSLIETKQKLILEFEQMMGPALREGYWQPENYTDYGDQKQQDVEFNLSISDGAIQSLSAELQSIIGEDIGDGCEAVWDDELFDDEDELFYYTGFESVDSNREKKAHYCVNLSDVNIPSDADLTQWSFAFDDDILSDVDDADTASYDNAIEKLHMFGFGSQAVIRYLAHENTDGSTKYYSVIPVLVLLGDTGLAEYSLENLTTKNTNQRIGNIQIELDSNNKPYAVENNGAINVYEKLFRPGANDFLVYPRIKFSSLQLKTDTSSLVIGYKNGQDQYKQLTAFEDYYLNTKIVQRYESTGTSDYDYNYYFMHFYTIKPDVLFQLGLQAANSKRTLIVNYILSNADTSIYLDALEVSKENAYPKVSYEVTPSLIDASISKKLYKQLARVIMINDTELKLEDTFGYISSIELNLDSPWEDTITVQNYTNKFEDLFSSIVAASEAMQKSQGMIGNMLAGGVPMSPDAFAESLDMNQTILDAYLDSHFDSSQVVIDTLTELFTDAASVLTSAQNSLNDVATLTTANAGILSGFVQNIAEDLTATTFRQKTQPTQFKEGDIWIKLDDNNEEEARYIATGNSKTSTDGGGWTRIADGTLAQIKGATLDIDAASGIISVEAEQKISLRSGKDIYLAAGQNVDIVGNHAVSIGGGTVNITGSGGNAAGAINIISSGINYSPKSNESSVTAQINSAISTNKDSNNNPISKVLIRPKKIELGGADILMRGSNSIQMIASRDTLVSTSALSITPEEGIWIGSGKGIRIYSGSVEVELNKDTGRYQVKSNSINTSGTSIELIPEHLLMGVSNAGTQDTTAIEMTDSAIVIAAGTALTSTSGSEIKHIDGHVTGEKPSSNVNSLIGAEFTKSSIGLATQTDTAINAIIMNDKGITLGSGVGGINLATSSNEQLRDYFTQNSGSYVRVNGDGIELGSLADLYINTDNFKLQTHSRETGLSSSTILAIGSGLNKAHAGYSDNSLTDITSSALPGESIDIRFLVNQKGAYINGTVYATAGSIGNGTKKVNIGTSTNNNDSYICSGITSIPSQNGPTTAGFYLGTDGFVVGNSDSYLKYTTSSSLTVQGAITATSGSIGSGSNKIIIGGNSSKAWIYHQLDSNAVPSGSTGGFYLGTDGFVIGDKNRYLQYTASGLTIKGDITATSFTLANNAKILGGLSEQLQKYKNDDPSDAWTQVIELSGRKIVLFGSNGLYITGSLEAVDGVYYLNKSLTRITNKHICLDLNENNYVHINETGIAIKGARISINGKEVWGRDDIIYSTKTPTDYPTDREWIWIRPQSNVNIYFDYAANDPGSESNTRGTFTDQTLSSTSQLKVSGTGPYTYNIELEISFGVSSDSGYNTQTFSNVFLTGKITGGGENSTKEFTTNTIAAVQGFSKDYAERRGVYTFTAVARTKTSNYGADPQGKPIKIQELDISSSDTNIRGYLHSARVTCVAVQVSGGTTCDVLYYKKGTGPS